MKQRLFRSAFLRYGCGWFALNTSGAALLYIVAALTLLGAIGAGIAVMSSSSLQEKLTGEREQQAYYVALSGLNYVKSLTQTDVASLLGKNSTYALNGNSQFKLFVSNAATPPPNYMATVEGVVNSATGAEASFRIASVTFTSQSNPDSGEDPSPPGHISPSDYVLGSYGGNLTLSNQQTVTGDIVGNGVTLSNQSSVSGKVLSSGNVTLVNHATVGGYVCAQGDVSLQNQTSVGGDIDATGDVIVGSNSATVVGSIRATGNVTLQNEAVVQGDVNAGGSVTLGSNNSKINGNVKAKGNITLNNGCIIGKNAYAGGNITGTWNGRIKGDAVAGGTITSNSSYLRVDGTKTQYASKPPLIDPDTPHACSIPSVPKRTEFTAGGTNSNLNWSSGTYKYSPGSYGTVTDNGKNTIVLTGDPTLSPEKAIKFKTFTLGWQSTLKLDVSTGYITILVEGDVNISGSNDIYISSDGSSWKKFDQADPALAAKVYIESHGRVSMGNQALWFGGMLSKGDISFGNQNELIGSFASLIGVINNVNQVDTTFVQSAYAAKFWQ